MLYINILLLFTLLHGKYMNTLIVLTSLVNLYLVIILFLLYLSDKRI